MVFTGHFSTWDTDVPHSYSLNHLYCQIEEYGIIYFWVRNKRRDNFIFLPLSGTVPAH